MKEEKPEKKRRPSGAYCVYFEYKMNNDSVPQVVFNGSEDQCRKHVEDYNRQSPEKYRCELKVDRSDTVYSIIEYLKEKYGTIK